jgi:hypothetical protein
MKKKGNGKGNCKKIKKERRGMYLEKYMEALKLVQRFCRESKHIKFSRHVFKVNNSWLETRNYAPT